MNKNYCGEEQRVFDAVHANALDSTLKEHVAHCVICTEIVLVAQYLDEQRRSQESEIVLPDAGLLWWKAQLRYRDAALARATRPIALVTKAGSAAIVLAGIWFASTPSAAREWIIDFVQAAVLQHATNPYWGMLALAAGAGTVLCAVIGSLFVLRN